MSHWQWLWHSEATWERRSETKSSQVTGASLCSVNMTDLLINQIQLKLEASQRSLLTVGFYTPETTVNKTNAIRRSQVWFLRAANRLLRKTSTAAAKCLQSNVHMKYILCVLMLSKNIQASIINHIFLFSCSLIVCNWERDWKWEQGGEALATPRDEKPFESSWKTLAERTNE